MTGIRRFFIVGLLACVAVALGACATGGGAAPQSEHAAVNPMPTPGPSVPVTAVSERTDAYTLGGGDELRVIVFGEEDLSGEFVVDGDGFVALPLIGEVEAGGLTLREFERAVAAALAEGYLRDPRVSAEVLNFRPFYIIGEVSEGGEYPYTQGMTVLNAVAVAGGYTYRADRNRVFITRTGSPGEVEYRASQSVHVLPGDIIRIPERFF